MFRGEDVNLVPVITRKTNIKLGVVGGFTRLIMKTKYVCHGLISPQVNFHNNQMVGTVNFFAKNCRWEKEPFRGWSKLKGTWHGERKLTITNKFGLQENKAPRALKSFSDSNNFCVLLLDKTSPLTILR